jgi:hypothetical protein
LKSISLRLAVPAFLLLTVSAVSEAAILHEDIGELKIQDLLLRPSFSLSEPGKGEFSIGESSVALRWELEQKYAGVIRIGPRTLINPQARYSSKVPDDITLVEAFAEYNDVYGRIRFGRLPVEFGYEGSLWERYLIFPRSLLFQQRAMNLRDTGISYFIQHNNWYTGVIISNGEGDSDQDGRTWYTGKWGYKADHFEAGISGQTGSTKPAATNDSGDTLAGVDPTREAKWRIGGPYINFSDRAFEMTMEYFVGELEQLEKTTKYSTGHADFGYSWTRRFATHFRYDMFDPKMRHDGDLQQQLSLALVASNSTHSSNLILVGSKNLEEGHRKPNDELRLIWSLSPSGVVRF